MSHSRRPGFAKGHITDDASSASVCSDLPPSDRTQKLKDARSEAAKEIEELKSKKEKEYESFKKEVSVGLGIASICE